MSDEKKNKDEDIILKRKELVRLLKQQKSIKELENNRKKQLEQPNGNSTEPPLADDDLGDFEPDCYDIGPDCYYIGPPDHPADW